MLSSVEIFPLESEFCIYIVNVLKLSLEKEIIFK